MLVDVIMLVDVTLLVHVIMLGDVTLQGDVTLLGDVTYLVDVTFAGCTVDAGSDGVDVCLSGVGGGVDARLEQSSETNDIRN